MRQRRRRREPQEAAGARRRAVLPDPLQHRQDRLHCSLSAKASAVGTSRPPCRLEERPAELGFELGDAAAHRRLRCAEPMGGNGRLAGLRPKRAEFPDVCRSMAGRRFKRGLVLLNF